jgi:excisionase family DNA binding protein
VLQGDEPFNATAHETIRNTMAYSLKEAAEAVGKSKPTILRAIQSGKISAKKDDHGEWLIEPAELHRVYEPASDENDARNGTHRNNDDDETPNETGALRQEVALLREMLTERDRRVADKDTVIDDLRNRLDAEADERRRTQAQLTGLLTDQRPKPEPKPRRRWWWRKVLSTIIAVALASMPALAGDWHRDGGWHGDGHGDWHEHRGYGWHRGPLGALAAPYVYAPPPAYYPPPGYYPPPAYYQPPPYPYVPPPYAPAPGFYVGEDGNMHMIPDPGQ